MSIPQPRTEAELDDFIYHTLGLRVPKKAVKPGHAAPWDAFCTAYFARAPVSVWLGARALAGKTFTLALLGWVEAITLRANVSILGGSSDQSEKVLEYLTGFWGKPTAPTNVLSSDPTQRRVDLVWGNKIRALTSSQKQARGGHPERLRLDEADEMDFKILEAVMGQPMGRNGVKSQTVISSTHHNAEGTMTRVLEMAKEKNWPVFQWGYPETLEPNGWLSLEQVERKKQEMTAEAWRIEVEMGEPSIEGRAFMEEKIEAMFVGAEINVEENDEAEFEPPVAGATYATGVDWGQSGHFTEIITLRTDVRPLRLVAYRYMRRRPYPEMVAKFDYRLQRYPGEAAHDYTGVGRVGEFLESGNVEDVTLVGRTRDDLFREYILAVEREELRSPRITRLYKQHKFCVRQGTPVLAQRGHVPIEQLRVGEFVATRNGWRRVQHVTRVGHRPVLRLVAFDGRFIDLTEDHRLATPDGWCAAGDLCAGDTVFGAVIATDCGADTHSTTPSSLVVDYEIVPTVGVPVWAVNAASISGAPALAAHQIGLVGDRLKMIGIATGHDATQMVQFATGWNRSLCQFETEHVREATARPRYANASVPVFVDKALPQPASVVVDDGSRVDISDGGLFACGHVLVHSITPCDVVDVWDIGVDGEPEFFANGFIAHNCRTVDLFGHGDNCHPPDGVVAGALANKAGQSAPVRLLFSEPAQMQVMAETNAMRGRAREFLRRSIRVRDDDPMTQ